MKFDFWELEEHVGRLWDRMITRASSTHFPQAGVQLTDMQKRLAILFRALGGDGALAVESASASEHLARRSLLQRIAGSGAKATLGWRDQQALRLPDCIDVFPRQAHNRNLYLWLAALAAMDDGTTSGWLERNRQLTLCVLKRYPGLHPTYRILVQAQLELRPDVRRLPADEAQQENVIRQVLQYPEHPLDLPVAARPPQPVYLWLHPSPPLSGVNVTAHEGENRQQDSAGETREQDGKRQARRSDIEKRPGGLLALRMENIFSWAEFANLDRSQDEEDDPDAASAAADDMDMVQVTRNDGAQKSRLKFDLDLPSEANDDLRLGEGILLPEWDYRKQQMKNDYCCVQNMLPRDCSDSVLPPHLKPLVHRLRRQFSALLPSRHWQRGQPDGSEIDLDAYLHFSTARLTGHQRQPQDLYRQLRASHRDLSTLLLADLSLSTDAWINNHARVIDVIRDGLLLFAESLHMIGDRFAMHGFSSRNRNHVRFNRLKNFDDHYDARIRGRIQAIKPGFYTRMGAAIRYASQLLQQQSTAQKLLLILTDGKPNDLDVYEGRYGIEDTRMAILEARQQGIQPFCVTIDEKAGSYLPHLFGAGHYIVIRKAAELPRELPLLYARLTR